MYEPFRKVVEGDAPQADNVLTERQRLERRRAELYQDPSLTNRSDITHKSKVEELHAIQRKLADAGYWGEHYKEKL